MVVHRGLFRFEPGGGTDRTGAGGEQQKQKIQRGGGKVNEGFPEPVLVDTSPAL